MATSADTTTTAMELPVVYVEADRHLAEVFVGLETWEALAETLRVLRDSDVEPRVAYAYQLADPDGLEVKLVLSGLGAVADEAALSSVLTHIGGLRVISIQPPTERGLVMSERQRPELAGTPAAIFGRPIIGSLVRDIVDNDAVAGRHLLAKAGRNAGRLAVLLRMGASHRMPGGGVPGRWGRALPIRPRAVLPVLRVLMCPAVCAPRAGPLRGHAGDCPEGPRPVRRAVVRPWATLDAVSRSWCERLHATEPVRGQAIAELMSACAARRRSTSVCVSATSRTFRTVTSTIWRCRRPTTR